ncbi:hypothetical protein KWH45_02260 [Xanthomonas campestris pv. mirabilis]|uniref:hypothetical protein n=1 Tax=Xanthomonas euvesicatoria TaxID=456327 RepID=UPI001C459734|nr:hypothetical protein [Xanthomonas euvesicatoria]MBV6852279.1 hypothetical protein [Xanthomonas campestris pv. mirabilis]
MRFAIIGVTFFIELNLTRARRWPVGATELISLLCLTRFTASLLQVSQISRIALFFDHPTGGAWRWQQR